jgi:hypothetical protein
MPRSQLSAQARSAVEVAETERADTSGEQRPRVDPGIGKSRSRQRGIWSVVLTGFAVDCREEYTEYTLLYAFGRRKFGFRAWNVDGFVSILRCSGWAESLGMDLRFCFCSFCLWCEIGSYWRELQARHVCQAILSCDMRGAVER